MIRLHTDATLGNSIRFGEQYCSGNTVRNDLVLLFLGTGGVQTALWGTPLFWLCTWARLCNTIVPLVFLDTGGLLFDTNYLVFILRQIRMSGE